MTDHTVFGADGYISYAFEKYMIEHQEKNMAQLVFADISFCCNSSLQNYPSLTFPLNTRHQYAFTVIMTPALASCLL